MKNQQVNVDYWAMAQTMFTYGALTGLCWIMLRLFHAVFTFPQRLRSQQENIQNTLQELQKRFPDMNITEEDLKNAENELEDFIKEEDAKKEDDIQTEENNVSDVSNDSEGEKKTK